MANQFKFAGLDGADEATISSIHVKIGQDIKKGDNLFDVEADKASDTVTSTIEGKISKINFKAGDTIKKGDTIIECGEGAIISDSSAAKEKPVVNTETKVAPNIEPTTSKLLNAKSENSQDVAMNVAPKTAPNFDFVATGTVLATPLARKIARDLGIDIKRVKGTGPNGRVLRADIEAAKNGAIQIKDNVMSAHNNNQATASTLFSSTMVNRIDVAKIESFGQVEHLKLTGIRKAVASAMATSVYTAPHVTLMIDLDATNLMNLRASLKEELLKQTIKLTYMPFFIKAVATALTEKKFELFNSTLDMANEEILVKKYYNIGMAADTKKGLVVPVIRNADKLTIPEIAKQVNQLGNKARDGQLKLDEMQGGTFTITNFGSAGLKIGTPVINYPEVAILGLGTLEIKPKKVNGEIVFREFFPLSLSIDHRVIDGAPAGYFLQRIKELLENPALLLL